MVGSGDRSEKIRTYNFPQNRVTDHRIGLTVHQLPSVLDGELDPLIEPLAAHERARALAEQSTGSVDCSRAALQLARRSVSSRAAITGAEGGAGAEGTARFARSSERRAGSTPSVAVGDQQRHRREDERRGHSHPPGQALAGDQPAEKHRDDRIDEGVGRRHRRPRVAQQIGVGA